MGLCQKSSCARKLYAGLTEIKKMWFGNQQFYPDGGSVDSIVIEPTSLSLSNSDHDSYYEDLNIHVTASTTAWTVSSSESSWLQVAKEDSSTARYWLTSNTGGLRTGYVYFKIGNTTYATCTIAQAAGASTSLSISPLTALIESAGTPSDQYVYVTASTTAWTVSKYETTGSGWLSAGKSNNSRAWYYLDPNTGITQRQGGLKFYIDGQEYADFAISQKAAAPRITVSPDNLRDLTNEAGSGYITVVTNISNWGAWITYKYPSTNWIGVTANTSTGRVNWSVTANDAQDTRTASITVSGAGISKTIAVTQTAGYVFYLSNSTYNASSAAGQTTVQVFASYQGSRLPITSAVTDNLGGANVYLLSTGPGYYNYNIIYPQRNVTTPSTLAIVFMANTPNQTVKTYVLTQSGCAPSDYVSISPTTMTGVSSAGTFGRVSVTASTTAWTATTQQTSWLTNLDKDGQSALTFLVAPAQLSIQRIGYINFSAGTATATLTVTQDGIHQEGVGEVVPKATSGIWTLGTIKTGEATINGVVYDIVGVCVVRENPLVLGDFNAHVDSLVYISLGGSATRENLDYSILNNDTFTVNNQEYYGKMIISPAPGAGVQDNSVQGFTVTRV